MKSLIITLVLLIFTNCLYAQEDKIVTSRVDRVLYKAIYKNDEDVVVIKAKDKVISRLAVGGVYDMKFVDFNKDGYKDLYIIFNSNLPGDNALFLYNKRKRNFTEVKNFGAFASATRLGNANLYYSYERAGCADMNWNSDLFKIVDFKAVAIGHISGLGCKIDEKVGVFIFKIKNENKLQIETYPISEIEKYKNYKWGFIKHYWRGNYRKFL